MRTKLNAALATLWTKDKGEGAEARKGATVLTRLPQTLWRSSDNLDGTLGRRVPGSSFGGLQRGHALCALAKHGEPEGHRGESNSKQSCSRSSGWQLPAGARGRQLFPCIACIVACLFFLLFSASMIGLQRVSCSWCRNGWWKAVEALLELQNEMDSCSLLSLPQPYEGVLPQLLGVAESGSLQHVQEDAAQEASDARQKGNISSVCRDPSPQALSGGLRISVFIASETESADVMPRETLAVLSPRMTSSIPSPPCGGLTFLWTQRSQFTAAHLAQHTGKLSCRSRVRFQGHGAGGCSKPGFLGFRNQYCCNLLPSTRH